MFDTIERLTAKAMVYFFVPNTLGAVMPSESFQAVSRTGPVESPVHVMFPSDFRDSPFVPQGRTVEEVVREKEANREALLALAKPFEGTAKRLIDACVEIGMIAHYNQYRSGEGSPHYSIHLLEVARRGAEYARTSGLRYSEIRGLDGNVIPVEAIIICEAVLHDTFEDITENLRAAGRVVDEGAAKLAMHDRVLRELTAIAGGDAAFTIVSDIDLLTNDDASEFPGRAYREKLAGSPYSATVKIADISHNLESGVKVYPEYYLTTSPFVVRELGVNEPFRSNFDRSFVSCLDTIGSILESSPRDAEDTKLARYIERVVANEGIEGLNVLAGFYEELVEKSALPREGRAAKAVDYLTGRFNAQ
jgi:hypothetical protein